MNEAPAKETLGFQAEVTQLLQLMIHSLYGNKQIFLRELVSNASDACDRLRFDSISNAGLLEDDAELKIRVSYDKAARTITVSDNGIGMSRQEVIDHIGTIAKSGTREFLHTLTSDKAKDAHLIGQFGVGFYASFIVADHVTIETRRAGTSADEGVRWESAGEGSYSVEPIRREQRGTDVVLHLRPEEDDLLSGHALRAILTKYSDHITVPILMRKEKWDADARAQVMTDEEEQVNQASALWARPKIGDHRRAVPRVLQARRARRRGAAGVQPCQSRRPPGVHPAALHPRPRAVRPVGSRTSPRHQAVRPSCLHHGRRQAAHAGVPPVRPGHHRLERPAAERVARNPAAVACRRNDSRGVGQARARTARRPRGQPSGEVRHLLEGVRPRLQGRHRRGCREQGSRRGAAAICDDA